MAHIVSADEALVFTTVGKPSATYANVLQQTLLIIMSQSGNAYAKTAAFALRTSRDIDLYPTCHAHRRLGDKHVMRAVL